MVNGVNTPDPAWTWVAVDKYIAWHLLGDDHVLAAVLAANEAAGLPDIDVSPTQARMLQLMARMVRARRILEIGTLGGYSTICLARALPEDGSLVTMGIDPQRLEVAKRNLDVAGVTHKVKLIPGPVADILALLEGPFDFVFIDAATPSNTLYLKEVMHLLSPGTAIVVGKVVREGAVLDAGGDDEGAAGIRAMFEAVGAEPRLTATAVQTVGAANWDGFLLALVDL
jgi:predicted O-methyltransferase YrrM